MRKTIFLAATAALALAACNNNNADDAAAPADDMEVSEVPNTTMAGPAAPATATTAAPFIRMAAIGDMFEIESSRLALEKSQNADVRRFAQMMIDEHTRASQTLKTQVEAMGNGMTVPTRLDPPHQAKIDALRAASGAEFERMYWQEQRTAHEAALALHRGYADGGDNEQLRTIARNMVGVVERHRGMIPAATAMGGNSDAAMSAAHDEMKTN